MRPNRVARLLAYLIVTVALVSCQPSIDVPSSAQMETHRVPDAGVWVYVWRDPQRPVTCWISVVAATRGAGISCLPTALVEEVTTTR